MTEWEEAFLNYLEGERRVSGCTVKNYMTDVRQFGEFLKEEDASLAWEDVDSDLLRDWVAKLMDEGTRPTTVNTKLSSIRAFYRFLLLTQRVEKDAVRLVQGPKKQKLLPAFVRDGEMNRLLDIMEQRATGLDGRRDRLVVLMLYLTGLRSAELVGLNVQDVDMHECQLKVTGKRNKQRVVPFGAELKQEIEEYLELRSQVKDVDGNAFFVQKNGARITYDTMRKMVRNALGMVMTASKRSPHVLRHTFATTMLNGGADLVSVKELLGHESVGTTQVYTHSSFEQLKQAYRNAHPRS